MQSPPIITLSPVNVPCPIISPVSISPRTPAVLETGTSSLLCDGPSACRLQVSLSGPLQSGQAYQVPSVVSSLDGNLYQLSASPSIQLEVQEPRIDFPTVQQESVSAAFEAIWTSVAPSTLMWQEITDSSAQSWLDTVSTSNTYQSTGQSLLTFPNSGNRQYNVRSHTPFLILLCFWRTDLVFDTWTCSAII